MPYTLCYLDRVLPQDIPHDNDPAAPPATMRTDKGHFSPPRGERTAGSTLINNPQRVVAGSLASVQFLSRIQFFALLYHFRPGALRPLHINENSVPFFLGCSTCLLSVFYLFIHCHSIHRTYIVLQRTLEGFLFSVHQLPPSDSNYRPWGISTCFFSSSS